VTIDTFQPITELASLDLIKIDAEQQEIPVLDGAKRVIERHRPIIFLENNNEQYGDALIQRVESVSYSPYWFCSARFQPDNFNRVPIPVRGADANMVCYPNEGCQPTGLMRAKTFAELKVGKIPPVTSADLSHL
jgi:hypothetical protein